MARVAVAFGLDRAELLALRGEADRPGGEIGGDVALGETAHGDGAVGEMGALQPVAEQIAARDDADGQDGRRNQE